MVSTGKHAFSNWKGTNSIFKYGGELKEHMTSYYYNLFGPLEENNFTMLENRVDDIPRVK